MAQEQGRFVLLGAEMVDGTDLGADMRSTGSVDSRNGLDKLESAWALAKRVAHGAGHFVLHPITDLQAIAEMPEPDVASRPTTGPRPMDQQGTGLRAATGQISY